MNSCSYSLIALWIRWMDERCLRPLFSTIKAELGRGQPGLMRWIWDETLPRCSIDRSTLRTAGHRTTSELAAAPCIMSRVSSFRFLLQQYSIVYSILIALFILFFCAGGAKCVTDMSCLYSSTQRDNHLPKWTTFSGLNSITATTHTYHGRLS